MEKKLVIVDGNAILHRAFHAIPPLTNSKGEPTNAVYGLVSMLLRVISDLKPTHLAVCFDEAKPTFRHKEFKEYQAQRPPTHIDLSSQFAKARDFLKASCIAVYSKEGYEADDVIATISKKAKVDSVVVVTGDRDLLQLVNTKTKLFMPVVGLSNGKLYGEKETLERMGVVPTLIPDFKALVGDPSDNYKGVAGIGPKTAVNLLNKYQSVDGIYKNIQKIPQVLQQKLVDGRADAILSHKLATVVYDVPFSFSLEEMSSWDLDSDAVISLFEDLGFKSLTERIKKAGKIQDEEKQATLF